MILGINNPISTDELWEGRSYWLIIEEEDETFLYFKGNVIAQSYLQGIYDLVELAIENDQVDLAIDQHFMQGKNKNLIEIQFGDNLSDLLRFLYYFGKVGN